MNNLINTIGLPSTDPRTWDAEYKVGDVVNVRSDFTDSKEKEFTIKKIEDKN